MNLEQAIEWRSMRSAARAIPALPQHLGQLLHCLSNAFEFRTLEKCHQRGHRKFRNSHSAVIAQLDGVGLCLGELAERVGISQQATGKLVRDLERAGYVHSHPDACDKRSRIIHLTSTGTKLQSDLIEAISEVREEFIEILGDSGLLSFEQQLRNAANALAFDALPK
jgi:DNA-binding MarR family transcriptional regulator